MAKLADLGLVKETETDLNLTKTGRGLGTPHFMAPEQFRNAKNVDVRCDIYSLGATLYMMVTGELPFKSTGPLDAWMKKIQNDLAPPRELVPALSERVDWAILRAMSADAEQRPDSCREFIEDLTGHSTRRVAVGRGDRRRSRSSGIWSTRTTRARRTRSRAATTAIRRSLADGLLGDAGNIRCSRAKAGPFEPLRDYPEFRDLLVNAAPADRPRPRPRRNAEEPTSAFPAEGADPVGRRHLRGKTSGRCRRRCPTSRCKHDDDEGTIGWGTWLLLLLVAAGSAAGGVLADAARISTPPRRPGRRVASRSALIVASSASAAHAALSLLAQSPFCLSLGGTR